MRTSTESESSSRFGSGSFAVARVESTKELTPVGGAARIVTDADAPGTSVPSAHATVGLPEHVPCEAPADAIWEPAGSEFVSVTPVAAEGPWFRTVIANVTRLPDATGFGDAVSRTERSARLDATTIVAVG